MLDFAAEASSPSQTKLPASLPLDGLKDTLMSVESIVPPLWPLRDYVAVNPFLGLSDRRFLQAEQILGDLRDCEMLPSREYFRQQVERGTILPEDAQAACQQCSEEYPELYDGINAGDVWQWIDEATPQPVDLSRRFSTVAEALDRLQGSTWSSHIVNDISRNVAAHYDEGQAFWKSPWKSLPLYDAWRHAAQQSYRMEMLGVKGFHELVMHLPETPLEAIACLLNELQVPQAHWQSFLLCEIFSVAGWASFVRYRVREAEMAGNRDDDLLGLLAIRLTYDVALSKSTDLDLHAKPGLFPAETEACGVEFERSNVHTNVAVRYALQVAAEIAYRRKICRELKENHVPVQRPASARKTAQMVFCIDVRSEVIRRHLESVSNGIETFGFAGFFGMALEFVPLGEDSGPAQCPVLLSPAFKVHETILGVNQEERSQAALRRQLLRAGRKLWKSFQTSAVSCFSFVESLGLAYFAKLWSDSFRWTRPVASAAEDGVARHDRAKLGPDVQLIRDGALSPESRLDLAQGMLRNLGLTSNFGRIVVLCGHGADVTNNPYKAGLDCGACGGHSGEPNARVAATLLNDKEVRQGLAERGISVPEDTWFVPAVHNTTTDQIQFFDTGSMPATHADEFQNLKEWTEEAGERTRMEPQPAFG